VENNLKIVLFPAFAPIVTLLAACSTPHGPDHGAGVVDACTAHRQATTPEARRAAAEAHIVQMHGSATPEHIERHLQMMERRCAAAGAAPRGT
jgi:hypothetical protein